MIFFVHLERQLFIVWKTREHLYHSKEEKESDPPHKKCLRFLLLPQYLFPFNQRPKAMKRREKVRGTSFLITKKDDQRTHEN